jgi:hypothetical protein
MHRAALDAATLGLVDGLYQMGQDIIIDARDNAPRDPEAAAEWGVPMMADTGFVQVWADGKRAAGEWQEKIPKLRILKGQVVLIVGFRSRLSHLNELGTIKEIARPFLLPAFNRALPGTSKYVLPSIAERIARVPE